MKNRKAVAILVVVIALFLAWYAFRPERLVVNHRVDDKFPTGKGSSAERTLASGTFYGIAHPTTGTATVYQLGDGGRVLRFTNFKTSNGPDVHVYLVAADDARDNASVERAGFIEYPVVGETPLPSPHAGAEAVEHAQLIQQSQTLVRGSQPREVQAR